MNALVKSWWLKKSLLVLEQRKFLQEERVCIITASIDYNKQLV